MEKKENEKNKKQDFCYYDRYVLYAFDDSFNGTHTKRERAFAGMANSNVRLHCCVAESYRRRSNNTSLHVA